jgi:hypothetical protein
MLPFFILHSRLGDAVVDESFNIHHNPPAPVVDGERVRCILPLPHDARTPDTVLLVAFRDPDLGS